MNVNDPSNSFPTNGGLHVHGGDLTDDYPVTELDINRAVNINSGNVDYTHSQAIAEQASSVMNGTNSQKRRNEELEGSAANLLKRNKTAADLQYLDMHDLKESCGRYYIEGDTYNYDFNYLQGSSSNNCLSIGSCRFHPFENVSSFDYVKYRNFLNKSVSIFSEKGVIFSPTKKPMGEKDELNPLDVMECEWDNYRGIENLNEGFLKLWKSFKDYKTPIEPELFEIRYRQALKVQENESYSVLSFGQFQQLFGFFMAFTVKKGKGWKSLPKFDNYIHHNILICRNEKAKVPCQAKSHYYVDCLHRLVIVRFTGKHTQACYEDNQEKCYPAFRSLLLSCPAGVSSKECIEYVKEKYANCYDSVIVKLGMRPSHDQLHNWKAKYSAKVRTKKSRTTARNEQVVTDTFAPLSLTAQELETPLSSIDFFPSRDNSEPTNEHRFERLTSRENAYSSSSHLENLSFYTSATAFRRMVYAETITIQTSHSRPGLTSYPDIVTICFKEERRGALKPRQTLGCLALIRHNRKEQFQLLIDQLKKVISTDIEYRGNFRCKNIVVNNGDFELNDIEGIFDNGATAYYAFNTQIYEFESNLDLTTTALLTKAMYSSTEEDCVNYIWEATGYYVKKLAQAGMNFEIETKYEHIIRDLSLNKSVIKVEDVGISGIENVWKSAINYIYKVYHTRKRWALYARLTSNIQSAPVLKDLQDSIKLKGTIKSPVSPDIIAIRMEEAKNILSRGDGAWRFTPNNKIQNSQPEPSGLIPSIEKALIDSDEIEKAAITISSVGGTEANDGILEAIYREYTQTERRNLEAFPSVVDAFLKEQDCEQTKVIASPEVDRYTGMMLYRKKLSPYKQMVLDMEVTAPMQNDYDNMMDFKIFSGYDLNREKHDKNIINCDKCVRSRILDLPCRHMLSRLMLQTMSDHQTVQKEHQVKIAYIARLDSKLMGRIGLSDEAHCGDDVEKIHKKDLFLPSKTEQRRKWIVSQIDRLGAGDYPMIMKDTITRELANIVVEKFPDVVLPFSHDFSRMYDILPFDEYSDQYRVTEEDI
jgi:hypothetical protein